MWFFDRSRHFVQNENGAVSTDWIVLTAFCIGVSVAASLITGDSVTDYGKEINASMTSRGIPNYGSAGGNKGLN